MIDIEAIKARAEAATPIVAVGLSKANAKFFEHAKGDVLALIAEVERLKSELKRVTDERDAAVEKEIKCPCHLRDFMEKEACNITDCNKCCPLLNGRGKRSE